MQIRIISLRHTDICRGENSNRITKLHIYFTCRRNVHNISDSQNSLKRKALTVASRWMDTLCQMAFFDKVWQRGTKCDTRTILLFTKLEHFENKHFKQCQGKTQMDCEGFFILGLSYVDLTLVQWSRCTGGKSTFAGRSVNRVCVWFCWSSVQLLSSAWRCTNNVLDHLLSIQNLSMLNVENDKRVMGVKLAKTVGSVVFFWSKGP